MPETLVVALGGNAITRPGEPGTIPQQFEHTGRDPAAPAAAVPQRRPHRHHPRQRPADRQHPDPRRGRRAARAPASARYLRLRFAGRHGLHDPAHRLRAVPPRRHRPHRRHHHHPGAGERGRSRHGPPQQAHRSVLRPRRNRRDTTRKASLGDCARSSPADGAAWWPRRIRCAFWKKTPSPAW